MPNPTPEEAKAAMQWYKDAVSGVSNSTREGLFRTFIIENSKTMTELVLADAMYYSIKPGNDEAKHKLYKENVQAYAAFAAKWFEYYWANVDNGPDDPWLLTPGMLVAEFSEMRAAVMLVALRLTQQGYVT